MSATARLSLGRLETALRQSRDLGRKLLIAYVTGGLGRDWLDVVRAIGSAGGRDRDRDTVFGPRDGRAWSSSRHRYRLSARARRPRGSSPHWPGPTPAYRLQS